MHGLNQLTASADEIEIDGRSYRLGPLVLRDYGEIENRVLARRPDPLAVAAGSLAGLEPAQQEFLLGRAYDRAATAATASEDEIEQWKRTPDGLCTLFWLMVRKHHPEITREQTGELVEQLAHESREQLRRRIDHGAVGPVGNRSGQALSTATAVPPHATDCRGTGGPAD